MAAATKSKPTNEVGYMEVDAKKLRPTKDRILLQWEMSQDEILLKAAGVTLVRPEKHKKMHYTGVVLAVGPQVDPAITVGVRLIFDQFSQFEKLFDPELGRLALIEESKQASCFAIIPPRVKIANGQSDYNYD